MSGDKISTLRDISQEKQRAGTIQDREEGYGNKRYWSGTLKNFSLILFTLVKVGCSREKGNSYIYRTREGLFQKIKPPCAIQKWLRINLTCNDNIFNVPQNRIMVPLYRGYFPAKFPMNTAILFI